MRGNLIMVPYGHGLERVSPLRGVEIDFGIVRAN